MNVKFIGFTGKLSAQYLTKNYPTLKIALAGRNTKLLNEIKSSLKSDVDVSVLEISDFNNSNQMDSICQQSKVVLSTAGPFAKIGSTVVDSCVRCCTNYCDTTGEANFVQDMINKHHTVA